MRLGSGTSALGASHFLIAHLWGGIFDGLVIKDLPDHRTGAGLTLRVQGPTAVHSANTACPAGVQAGIGSVLSVTAACTISRMGNIAAGGGKSVARSNLL